MGERRNVNRREAGHFRQWPSAERSDCKVAYTTPCSLVFNRRPSGAFEGADNKSCSRKEAPDNGNLQCLLRAPRVRLDG